MEEMNLLNYRVIQVFRSTGVSWRAILLMLVKWKSKRKRRNKDEEEKKRRIRIWEKEEKELTSKWQHEIASSNKAGGQSYGVCSYSNTLLIQTRKERNKDDTYFYKFNVQSIISSRAPWQISGNILSRYYFN